MSNENKRGVSRRSVLGGIAGLGTASILGATPAAAGTSGRLFPDNFTPSTPVESYHPGAPRFVSVGEPIKNPIWGLGCDTRGLNVDGAPTWALWDKGRDQLSPRLASLSADPSEYSTGDFKWSLVQWPDGSGGPDAVLSFTTATASEMGRYDENRKNVAEFEADAPGRYVLELEAPDGTHQLTLHAFNQGNGGAGYYLGNPEDAPRITLESTYDADNSEFVIETNAKVGPNSGSSLSDLWTEFLADDRDALSTSDIQVAATV